MCLTSNAVLCEFCRLCLHSCVLMVTVLLIKTRSQYDLQCVGGMLNLALSINAVGCLVDGRDRGD